MCGDDDRGYTFEGRRYSQFADSFYERLTKAGVSVITIASPDSVLRGDAVFGKVFIVNGLLARALLKRRLLRFFGRKVEWAQSPTVDAWKGVLKRVKPRAIIGIQPPAELCIAARAEGIWIADLQHGILSDEGYYGSGYRARLGQEGWPDCVLCWDDASAAWASSRLPASVELRVIGNPWLLRFAAQRSADELVKQANRGFVLRAGRRSVLISLQWGFEGNPEYDETGIPKQLLDVILDKDEAYDWLLRIHPMLLKPEIRERTFARLAVIFRGRPNVNWDSASTVALPVLLRQVHCHVTSHSAVTIEAAVLGVPTAVLDRRHDLMHEWFGEQLSSGIAELIPPEKGAIREWLARVTRTPDRSSPSRALNLIDALDAFISELSNPRRVGLTSSVSSTQMRMKV